MSRIPHDELVVKTSTIQALITVGMKIKYKCEATSIESERIPRDTNGRV